MSEMEPILSGFLEEEGERGGDQECCGEEHMQNSLISHLLELPSPHRLPLTLAVAVNGPEESSPHPCILQAPASSPTLVLHQGSGGVEFVREGCEENPTGAIASRLGEGGRQRTAVCKYAKWPASSVPARVEGERELAKSTHCSKRQLGPS